MDTGTKEIAEKLADLLGQKMGSRPHLVIMEVHRSQIDANREVREACMHCEACEKVYKDYHSKVCQSKWSDGACAHKSVRSKKRALRVTMQRSLSASHVAPRSLHFRCLNFRAKFFYFRLKKA